jgi:hypothetical protein
VLGRAGVSGLIDVALQDSEWVAHRHDLDVFVGPAHRQQQ